MNIYWIKSKEIKEEMQIRNDSRLNSLLFGAGLTFLLRFVQELMENQWKRNR